MTTQQHRTGSVEQVLRVLEDLGSSAAYSTELARLVDNLLPAMTLYDFRDANGTAFQLSLDDTQFGGPGSWFGKTQTDSPLAFAKILITDQLRIAGPYPLLLLVAHQGKVYSQQFEEAHSRQWLSIIDAVAICSGSDPGAVQREALGMIDAYEQLINRNQQLGGLVQMIRALMPPQPSGAQFGQSGVMAAALVRFECWTLRLANA